MVTISGLKIHVSQVATEIQYLHCTSEYCCLHSSLPSIRINSINGIMSQAVTYCSVDISVEVMSKICVDIPLQEKIEYSGRENLLLYCVVISYAVADDGLSTVAVELEGVLGEGVSVEESISVEWNEKIT